MIAFMALCLLTIGATVADRLVSVQVLFRHGDRAPSSPYPKDLYTAKHWPNGWSQLTERGQNETFELGQFLRNRYGNEFGLLSETHDPEKVLVRSTSKQRAIDSASNVIRGLYPTPSNTTVEIRVLTPHTEDLLLKPNSYSCAAYDRIVNVQNAKLFRQYNKRFERFFKYLSIHTGYDVTMENVDKVFDAVYRETVHVLPQPEWLLRKFVDNAGKTWNVYDLVLELKRVQRLSEFWTPELSKLRTGFLLGQISRRMQESAANTSASENFVLYSSHDATLTSLLYNMGTSNDLLTPYAAAVIFELYEGAAENGHYVKVLYRNETTAEPYVLHVPTCPGAECSLTTFLRAMANRSFWSKDDAVKECATPQ